MFSRLPRALKLSLALAGVAAISPGAALAQTDKADWLRTLEPAGWSDPIESLFTVMYTRPAPAADRPRILQRFEEMRSERHAGFEYRSAVVLSEVDCQKRGARELTVTLYAGQNMTGATKTAAAPANQPWSYPEDGMLQALAINVACRQ